MASSTPSHKNDEPNVIFSYSRKQAIDDGVLVDVTDTAKLVGFKHHTVVTQAVWGGCIESEDSEKQLARLSAVLRAAMTAVRESLKASEPTDRVYFTVSHDAPPSPYPRDTKLYMVCGPGDTAAPVLTIMEIGED